MKKIIIDAGFGDSGKGIVTDWLCSSASKPALVVRHSGGHQCGHTVVDGEFRHVFSNFGSGSYREVPTYWSKFCTVEPRGFLKELGILKEKGVDPEIYIDPWCPVTTPYDIVANQHRHRLTYHGSCGVGFGATMQREEDFYSLVFYDLYFPDILQEKLRNIRNYYRTDTRVDVDSVCEENFLNSCADMVNVSNIKKERPSRIQDYIFEGSQGLLLDQHFGFFPHVTRSNTGTKNALDVLTRDFNQFYHIDEIFLVSRAYQTRHGSGWMSNQHIPHKIEENPNETNKEHAYQGTFRRTLLDVSLMEYAINRDEYIRDFDNKRLVLTCLDHVVNDYRFTYEGNIISCVDENEFVGKISEILGIKDVYLSHSEESKGITKWKK